MRLTLTALLLTTTLCSAAPVLAQKPPRFEYAELTFRNIPGRAAGVDQDGNEVPAVPASMVLRFVSGSGEIEAKGWADLADKLKASGFKKEGSAAFQKIQLLNHLGNDGWEMIEHQQLPSGLQVAGGGPGGRPTTTLGTANTGTLVFKKRTN